ncbi:GTPaseactivator protein for Ras-like GTPase [Acanthamoeba castellanii str. Neff]|uniref:GTPaseactivator protein for Ras-like GTPase n=1 Tax=Acanthamoeba castellanii (strain ATCC 30010 / Neff) TaxID=1257118 RepID=L8GJB0_ACACF|nr:GTPaseactivator protein for Ras-like GTPase [Acanthamoeba castellanii str. Neff]ELR12939.1 GTPaseactivator protein for Ras-like GTPase [Acanthamoeba castellanii str. Neff]
MMRSDQDDDEEYLGRGSESPRLRATSPTSPRHQPRHWHVSKSNDTGSGAGDTSAAASTSTSTTAGGSGSGRSARRTSPSVSPRLDHKSGETRLLLSPGPTRLRGPGTVTIGSTGRTPSNLTTATAVSGGSGGGRRSGSSSGRGPRDGGGDLYGSNDGTSGDDEEETDEDLDDNELVNVVSNNSAAGRQALAAGGKQPGRKKSDPSSPGRRRPASSPKGSASWLSGNVSTPATSSSSSAVGAGPGASATLRRQRKEYQPQQRDPDEAVFRFWMLVEDFKRQKDRQAKAYLADILYTQYLVPSTAESSTSPYFVSALRMPPDILDSIEQGVNAAANLFLSRNLFDAAQNEVWKHMRKRPFPSFMKQIFNASLFCSNPDTLLTASALRDLSDAERRKVIKQRTQLPLRIPEVIFSGFVRFLTNRKWDIDAEALDDDWAIQHHHVGGEERVTVSTTTFAECSIPCYRGDGTLNVPPHKALDIISSVDERCCWDDMYSMGRVEQMLGEPTANLLRVDTWVPGEKEGGKFEQLVLRTARRLKDGSAIYLWRSVEHPDFTEKGGAQRLECHISGFFIQPHEDPRKSTISSLSMLDTKGLVSPEVARAMNLLQARLPLNLNRYIASIEKRSARLLQAKLVPPVLLPACYDCNCPWNPWPEDEKEKERDMPRLSFNEGDSVVLLEPGPDPSAWTGYSFDSGLRGALDIDYFRYAMNDGNGTAGGKSKKRANNYMPLIELLSRSDLMIITALCSTTDTQVAERVAHGFLHVLRMFPGRTIPLLVGLIGSEVRKTGIIQGSTLFRGNDIASHLLSAYCQSVGRKFLLKVIRPLVEKVLTLYSQNKSMEIDPARAVPGEDPEENAQTLSDFCHLFLNTITSSIKHCPMSFRAVCYHLQREVIKKFPQSKYIVLTNFFFLRFISPAIVSPEAFGILEEQVSPKCRRGLVLVSKVMQNLANGVEFGEKEEHMLRLNGFIRENLAKVEAFFEEIASESSTEEELAERELTLEEAYPSASYLHSALCCNLDRIAVKVAGLERSKKILNHNNNSSGNNNNSGDGPAFLQLLEVLLECGMPTMNVNTEDPRDYIRGDKKFSLVKKPRSGRLKRNKDDHHGSGSDSSERHKPAKEKERERKRKRLEKRTVEADKRDVERTRSERTREKLSGRERGATPHQSPSSGRHDGAPESREVAGDSGVPASPGRTRSDSLEGSEEGMNSIGSEPASAATEKTGGEGGAKEKSSAFLKISMIKKSGLMDRLNKKRSAKKSPQGDKSNSVPSGGVGGVAALIRDNNNNSSSKDSDDEDEWASTSSDRGLSSDDEDSYVSDTDSVDNTNSEGAAGKTSSSSSSSSSAKRHNRGNYTARERSTANRSPSNHRRNGGGAAAPLAKSTRSSKDGSRTERDKKPGAAVTPAATSVSKKMSMAALSKQLESLHEERVKAFKEVERFFMSQSKLSILGSGSGSSPVAAHHYPLAVLSPRSTDRGMQPHMPTTFTSPYIIEEFRKLMAVYEDKVRQEERLVQALVYLSSTTSSSMTSPPSPSSPASSSPSSSQGMPAVAVVDEQRSTHTRNQATSKSG